jgi:superfamily I DNA and/or RNA helicase
MIHLDNSCELFKDQSYYNPAEAETVKALVSALSNHYEDIGVLSPYTAQVNWLVQQKLTAKCEVKTIDSFQGREKSVIVFSSVRAHKEGKFGK